MKRNFSLAGLMLVIALTAIGLASLREAWLQAATAKKGSFLLLPIAGGMAGAIYGFGLAIWQRHPFLQLLGGVFVGFFLGVAVMSQATLAVPWPAALLLPVILIGGAVLYGLNRRRSLRALQGQSPPMHPNVAEQPTRTSSPAGQARANDAGGAMASSRRDQGT